MGDICASRTLCGFLYVYYIWSFLEGFRLIISSMKDLQLRGFPFSILCFKSLGINLYVDIIDTKLECNWKFGRILGMKFKCFDYFFFFWKFNLDFCLGFQFNILYIIAELDLKLFRWHALLLLSHLLHIYWIVYSKIGCEMCPIKTHLTLSYSTVFIGMFLIPFIKKTLWVVARLPHNMISL